MGLNNRTTTETSPASGGASASTGTNTQGDGGTGGAATGSGNAGDCRPTRTTTGTSATPTTTGTATTPTTAPTATTPTVAPTVSVSTAPAATASAVPSVAHPASAALSPMPPCLRHSPTRRQQRNHNTVAPFISWAYVQCAPSVSCQPPSTALWHRLVILWNKYVAKMQQCPCRYARFFATDPIS